MSEAKRKVFVINQYALPRTQGGGTRHIDLFSRLTGWDASIYAGRRNHYTQEVFTTDDPHFKLTTIPAYTGPTISRIRGWIVFALRAFLEGVFDRRISLVYASTPQILVPVAGALIASIRHFPLIVEIRDLWPDSLVELGGIREGSLAHRLLRGLERWIYQRADHLVAVTAGWEPHFLALGIPAEKIVVIPNGTEIVSLPTHDEREDLRSEFGIKRPTAIFAGAHGTANALDLVLDAAKLNPDGDVILIGSGPEKARLESRTDVEKIHNVRFCDPLPKNELFRLLCACDAGIHCVEALPVLDRGMSPNKVFDYMVVGLPVISNAKKGLRAIGADNEIGRLGGPGDLASCLKDVLNATQEQRDIWGENGRAIVIGRFSRSAAAQELEALLDHTACRA